MQGLGPRLKRARKARGWTQGELARRAGVKQPTISDLERGRSASSIELPMIAKALGVSTDELAHGGDARRPGDAIDRLSADALTIAQHFDSLPSHEQERFRAAVCLFTGSARPLLSLPPPADQLSAAFRTLVEPYVEQYGMEAVSGAIVGGLGSLESAPPSKGNRARNPPGASGKRSASVKR